ncbi:erythromycin esterase family protein [Sorangium sp. So ce542]|uniref:erythromycin esterase family protein n=1 Tax=Sorangium sp. So ce542 TaxID=3133316 RepID=UPI003F60AE3F
MIVEAGASFIAVEGDWPERCRAHRHAKGCADAGSSARAVLRAFDRWPTWMRANEEVADAGRGPNAFAKASARSPNVRLTSSWAGVHTPLRRQVPTRPDVQLTSSFNHHGVAPSRMPLYFIG